MAKINLAQLERLRKRLLWEIDCAEGHLQKIKPARDRMPEYWQHWDDNLTVARLALAALEGGNDGQS